MNMKFLLILWIVLLLCGCSQRIADPVEKHVPPFQVVECDQANDFFGKDQDSFAKPSAYYACACPGQDSDTVTIIISIPEPMWVDVIVRNATGYDLRSYSGDYGAGEIEIRWDRKSKKGKRVKPGIYIVHARTEDGHEADIFLVLE
jgi:hypothetical protein